jgi:hypothetical protein
MAITQNITALPPAGHRGVDIRTVFVTKQEAFQDTLQAVTVTQLNSFATQANQLQVEVNATQQLAEDYAVKTAATVETGTYSAKEFALGDLTATGGSAKAWAVDASNPDGIATSGSAKSWATKATTTVDGTSYSSKEYASGDATASGGSAKAWAIDSSSPNGTTDKSAKTLATEAAASASTATTQAGIATTKASEASTSATNAASSASTATTQAGLASTSATNAATSATAASGSASTASAQATNAAASATTASTQATNAASSASSSSTSAATATTQATNASSSATSASGSATTATTQAGLATTARIAAEAALDAFDDRYLGSKTSAPTLDNDGNALVSGALYFNDTLNAMYVYDLGTTTWISLKFNPTDHTTLSNIGTRTHTQLESDIALKANIASPVFTGNVTGLGVSTGTSFNSITGLASVAPVAPAVTAVVGTSTLAARQDHVHPTNFTATATDIKMNGTQAVGTLTTFPRADHVHPIDTSRAPLASPALTGTPTAPTAATTVNSTQLATTAFATPRTDATGASVMPAGTTAQRPVSPVNGYMRYNSELLAMEAYVNGAWGSVGGGATGGGTDSMFILNGTTISSNYTIPTGKNAGTFGPITIADGVVVTIPNGSTWSII